MRKKLLWVGDAACPSGFARSTHGILDTLHKIYDVTVLGINYNGDPHSYPYPIYCAAVGGDMLGVERFVWMCDTVNPDIIVLQNDFWHIPLYMKKLRMFKEYDKIPVVGFIAVDGKNVDGRTLNQLDMAIFWTEFAEKEATLGGFIKPSGIVSLGLDKEMYSPGDRIKARSALGLPTSYHDKFIVGNVNRNQWRKRLDLTVRYFARWVRDYNVDDACLFLHIAPTGDQGFDVTGLARYYGILDRLMLREPPVFYGETEEVMRDTYRSFNALMTTTQGEGFGLTSFEAMACAVPVIAPDWSALGEFLKDAALLVPCTSTAGTNFGGAVIGGIADEKETIEALNALYRDEKLHGNIAMKGFKRARESRFDWDNAGEKFAGFVQSVLTAQKPVVA